jgi:hypothetical protein
VVHRSPPVWQASPGVISRLRHDSRLEARRIGRGIVNFRLFPSIRPRPIRRFVRATPVSSHFRCPKPPVS